MKKKEVWTEIIEDKVSIEIALHAVGESYTPHGLGIFNYYIYIYEQHTAKDLFESLWLEDEEFQITPESPKRIRNDYYSLDILNHVDFHGGITYYSKHGYTEGFRLVQLGCDYNHLWDMDHPPSFDGVVIDAKKTARQVLEWLKTTKIN